MSTPDTQTRPDLTRPPESSGRTDVQFLELLSALDARRQLDAHTAEQRHIEILGAMAAVATGMTTLANRVAQIEDAQATERTERVQGDIETGVRVEARVMRQVELLVETEARIREDQLREIVSDTLPLTVKNAALAGVISGISGITGDVDRLKTDMAAVKAAVLTPAQMAQAGEDYRRNTVRPMNNRTTAVVIGSVLLVALVSEINLPATTWAPESLLIARVVLYIAIALLALALTRRVGR